MEGVLGVTRANMAMLRSLVLALNNYAGCGPFSERKLLSCHKLFLGELMHDIRDVQGWQERFKEISWHSFFQHRGVDYQGDEVATAQYTSWPNLAPAIPKEVGTVHLRDVVEGGLVHYVGCFEQYFLPEEFCTYTEPPRVMVHDDAWPDLCANFRHLCTPAREGVAPCQGEASPQRTFRSIQGRVGAGH